jgi:hypothetical protein
MRCKVAAVSAGSRQSPPMNPEIPHIVTAFDSNPAETHAPVCRRRRGHPESLVRTWPLRLDERAWKAV